MAVRLSNYNSEIDVESIITAPLVAASKANVVMATGQQRFILDYCFAVNKDGTHEPIMIEMERSNKKSLDFFIVTMVLIIHSILF